MKRIDSNDQLFQLLEQRLNVDGLLVARRLLHGRGQCYPLFDFLTVDWFAPALLFVIYKNPGESLEYGARKGDFIADLEKWFKGVKGVNTVVVQHRWTHPAETIVIGDPLPQPHHVEENGLIYKVDLNANQNVGLFLDAGEIRKWVRKNAANRTVLNLFAYTCSFSVAALAGGANKVVNIDMSRGALTTGQINHSLNHSRTKGGIVSAFVDSKKAIFLSHNIFKSWGKLRQSGPYDLIIVDPPSHQPGSFVAKKDYAKIVSKLSQLLNPEGVVVSVLNSPMAGFDFLRDIYAKHAPNLNEIERLAAPVSFEEIDKEKGLKIIVFRRRDVDSCARVVREQLNPG